MWKVSVNGESQRLVVREITDNTDHLLENMMMDCWVLVFALDNKQSFGKKLTSSRTAPSQAKARPVVCIVLCCVLLTTGQPCLAPIQTGGQFTMMSTCSGKLQSGFQTSSLQFTIFPNLRITI